VLRGRQGGDASARRGPGVRSTGLGSDEAAWGTKWVIVAVRSNDVHGRVILDVDWLPASGSETTTAMQSFAALAPRCPGAQGVLYDTALRGVHHQTLLRDLGWLPVNRVTAANARTKQPRCKDGRRVEKSTHIEDRTVTHADGTETTISLFTLGGAIGNGHTHRHRQEEVHRAGPWRRLRRARTRPRAPTGPLQRTKSPR